MGRVRIVVVVKLRLVPVDIWMGCEELGSGSAAKESPPS